jgi:hypothetical protein
MHQKERTMKKRFLSLQWQMALSVGALLLAVCLPAQAASDFDLTTEMGDPGTPAEYTWNPATHVLTVNDGADITITGDASDGTRIEVAANAAATITLDNASITLSGSSNNESPLQLDDGADVTLNLTGNNLLQAGNCSVLSMAAYCAGISVPDYSVPGSTTQLTINGPGELTANGSQNGAGIGGSGPNPAAGSGMYSSAGTITINSGTVNANSLGGGFGYGAGIGGGPAGSGGTITITGGTVNANSELGAGIGGGDYGGAGGIITISGGTVEANGGSDGSARIGGGGGSTNHGGMSSTGGTITITGDADVTARGGAGSGTGGGAGIGSGGNNTDTPAAAGTITIDTTGTVRAQGGSGFPGTSGAGANIGQGGYIDSTGADGTGAGIQVFVGPVLTSPSPSQVALGGEVNFTCEVTPVTGPAGGLDFGSSAWDFSDTTPAGATTTWLSWPSSWPPSTEGGITGISGGLTPTVLTLLSVKANDLGYYRCAVKATYPDDLSSSILYIGQQAVELKLPGAATPVPALNPAALALLGLALAGLAGLGRRRG